MGKKIDSEESARPSAAPPHRNETLARHDDVERLEAVRKALGRRSQVEAMLDRFTGLAAEATGAPTALLTVVTEDAQVVLSRADSGGRLPVSETPLSHSLCKFVVEAGTPLVVQDTRDHASLRENGALTELGIQAYLGAPVKDHLGHTLGSLCVLEFSPRSWSAQDVRVVTGLAEAAAQEIERANRELALAANETHVRTLLNNLDAICWETDAKTQKSVYVSEQAGRLLGYPTEAWLEGPDFWVSRLHPDDRERAVATSQTAVAEGRPYAHEYRMVAADGRTVWVRDLVEVVTNDNGEVASLQGIMFDITESKTAELELRASEERYRALVEHAPNCTYLQDAADFRVTYISPRIETMLGYDADEWLRDPNLFTRILHPDDRAQVLTEVARCRREGEPFRMEYRVMARDGRLVWCYDATVPVLDSNRAPQFRQGFLVDITETKTAQEALTSSEARYRALVEHSTDLIAVIGADGVYKFASRSHEQQLGYLPADLLGTKSLALVHPDDASLASALVSSALDGSPPRATLIRMRDASGQWHTIEGVAKRLNSDTGTTALLIGRDVTARFAADRERELRTMQLQALATATVEMTAARSPEAIAERGAQLARELIGADAALTTVLSEGAWAPAIRKISQATGAESRNVFDADDLVGPPATPSAPTDRQDRGPRDLPACDRTDFVPEHSGVLSVPLLSASGEPLGSLQLAAKTDGSDFTSSDEAILTQLAQAMSATLERARLEERLRQSQKMEAIGQLAGGVAHDFNNLLTAIGGYSEIALDAIPSDAVEARDAVLEVKAAGDRAAALTRQLLTFSRKHVITPEVFAISEVVKELVPMLGRLIGEDITIACESESSAAPIRADRALLGQVIVNLATNARDAMPTGGILTIAVDDITVSHHLNLDEAPLTSGRYTRLAVSDSGTGMDETTRKRSTEPFYTTKEIGAGTGLGLSTVHGIVGDSAGVLQIDSAPGAGTTVSVYFPVAAVYFPVAEPPAETAATTRDTAPSTPVEGARILLVEDEDIVRSLVVRMLSAQGYQVSATGSPLEAIAHIEEAALPFDLLITDVVMPEMSGPDLVRTLGPSCPAVLYTSGYAGGARAKHGLEGDDVSFLQKPFTLTGLSERVEALLTA